MSAFANPLTTEEKALARHALGLDGRSTTSSRNYFVAEPGSEDHTMWVGMADRQFARRRKDWSRSLDAFVLTRAGADRALEPGETLDTENFPKLGQD